MRVVVAAACVASLIAALLLTPGAASATAPSAQGWSRAVGIEPSGTDPGNAALTGVSCPSQGFCVAVDNSGNALTWHNGTWSPNRVGNGSSLTGISCSSIRRCVAVSVAGAAFSYNGISWGSSMSIGASATYRVSCPTAGFCGAVGASGTAGAPSVTATQRGLAWTSSLTHSTGSVADRLLGVSCPAADQCAAVNFNGQVLTLAGASWAPEAQALPPGATSISCPSTSMCLAVGTTSVRAAGLDSAWFAQWSGGRWSTARPIPGLGNALILSSSCPSVRQCMVIGLNGKAVLWTHNTWSTPKTVFRGYSGSVDVSCGAVDRCIAVNSKGLEAEYR